MILDVQSLTRTFGGLTAVDAMTMSAREGEVFGLVGPNGAGKTTAIKMFTTLLEPTSGKVFVGGFDVARQPSMVRRTIGYVPQAVSVDGSLTGFENLLLFAKLYDIPRAERQSRIHDALELTGLTDAAHRMVRQYSGGMIRRLEIAQSTLHRPPLLFLDEPTVGLDPVGRKAVWDHLERLRAEYGATIFLTTHYMEEADILCDRLAIIHRGKLIVVDTPERLKSSIGGKANLGDVFLHYAGDALEPAGDMSDTSKARRAVRRRG
jgi:ABC-2 type transport system ATP-binding protein